MIRTALLASLMVTVVGCKSFDGPPYQPNPPDPTTTSTNLRVAITKFDGFECRDTYNCGKLFYDDQPFLIMAVGAYWNIAVGMTETDYRNGNFEQCLVEELSASHAFKEVKYLAWEDLRVERKAYDVVITGTNYFDARWHYSQFLFCLLGLPCGIESREASMAINVAFTDRPAMPVMQETIAFTVPTKPFGGYWFYEHPRIDSRCPSEDLQPLFLKFRKKLQEAVRTQIAKTAEISKIQEAR